MSVFAVFTDHGAAVAPGASLAYENVSLA